ncbi:hypothetical protein ECA02_34200 [Enterococcus casseliflavus]|nr:hypothetical protein ECA02_34200 [Enterococcus casseliflavus]
MKGLPEQIEDLFDPHASVSDLIIADRLAYSIIVIVILLLIWTILELVKGEKRYLKV